MRLHRILRNTHLFLGLFSCLWLLMYGVSSVQMAHSRWFSLEPAVSVSRVKLPAEEADARAVARELTDRHGVRGEVTQVRTGQGRLRFTVTRPGTVCQVEYAAETGEASVRENRAGFMGMLNRLHHVGGLRHAYWMTNMWGAFTGIVSAALFGIGLTGIYLWFKMHRERRTGAVLLALSLGYSLTLMVLLRGIR